MRKPTGSITIRETDTIWHEEGGWFDARWHFSFDRYRDPEQMGIGDLIFTAARKPGGALSGATVVHALHRICEDAGLPRIRFHDTRHTAATIISGAVGIAEAKAVLGHSTLARTERYVHQSATSPLAAAAIDAALGGSVDAAVDAV